MNAAQMLDFLDELGCLSARHGIAIGGQEGVFLYDARSGWPVQRDVYGDDLEWLPDRQGYKLQLPDEKTITPLAEKSGCQQKRRDRK